jgi:AraC family transcriptional activator of pobA
MEFFGKLDEYLYLETVSVDQSMQSQFQDTFSILWVINPDTTFVIDGQTYTIQPFQLVFLTNIQKIESYNNSEFRIIKFNRHFYCLDNHDQEIGCKGALFYGSITVPIININPEMAHEFNNIWENLQLEFTHKDSLQFEMLQIHLKRLLILSMRIFRNTEIDATVNKNSELIKNFYYFVELHYKTKKTVQEYADLLNITPKSLTNHFMQFHEKKPLKIIHERTMMEAKRLITKTNKNMKEIAFDLGFEDNQSFSRFFKANVALSPSEFKNNQN